MIESPAGPRQAFRLAISARADSGRRSLEATAGLMELPQPLEAWAVAKPESLARLLLVLQSLAARLSVQEQSRGPP
jgi:hypothetical protein